MVNPPSADDPRLSDFIKLQNHIERAQQSLSGDHAQISAALAVIQHLFQSQVQVLTWDNWPIQQRSLLQSVRVEMHKQLRLLTTDLMFFKAAKQVATLDQRRGEMGDRLTQLQGYCDVIIKWAGEQPPTESPSEIPGSQASIAPTESCHS